MLEFFNRDSFDFCHSLLLVVGFYNIHKSQNGLDHWSWWLGGKDPRRQFAPLFFSLQNLRLFKFLFLQSPLGLFFFFSVFLYYASLAALRVIPPALKFLVLPPRWGGLRAISGPTPASRLNVELASESLSSSTTTFFFALLLLFSTTRLGAVFFTVLGAGRGGRRDLMVTPRLSFVVIRSSWNEESLRT